MQAITQDVYGPPAILRVESVERPAIGPRQVLVQVEASPVTYGDRRLRASDFPGVSWLPGRMMMGLLRPKNRIPGTNFAGRVAAIGAEVTRFAVGDAVFGTVQHGAHADYVCVDADGIIAPMPSGMAPDAAAALPYGALTALAFMRDYAAVQPGEQVLIIGAAGEVGRFAVQIAAHLGAEVTAVCRGRDTELVRGLGASRVIDFTTTDFTRTGDRYDVIFDTPAVSRFGPCQRALTSTGRYLCLNVSVGLLLSQALSRLIGGPQAIFNVAMGNPADLETVRALAEEGVIRPVVGPRFPMARIADAHTAAAGPAAAGTVVVTFDAERPALAAA